RAINLFHEVHGLFESCGYQSSYTRGKGRRNKPRGDRVNVTVHRPRRRNQAVRIAGPSVRSDDLLYAVGDVRIAGPPYPGDPSVLDADIGLANAEHRIDHHDACEHQIQVAVRSRTILLGLTGPPIFGEPPHRFVAVSDVIRFYANSQVRVAELHQIARG